MVVNSTSRSGKPWEVGGRLLLDSGLVSELIRSRHTRDSLFIDAWAEKFDDIPDRSTVHNWKTKGMMPRTLTRLLRLAAILDCDPFLLLSHHVDSELMSIIVSEAALGLPSNQSIQSRSYYELFGPRAEWPNAPRLREISNTNWQTQEFEHKGTPRAFYQTVEIIPKSVLRPLAFHFAFRIPFSPVWFPYGTVAFETTRGVLNNFNIPTDRGICVKELGEDQPFDVSTWFGQGPCYFRVTSVHEFDLSLNRREEKILRFVR